jgi:hypothetical protein
MHNNFLSKWFRPQTIYIHTPKGTLRTLMADSFFSRMRGLLWRKPLESTEAILLSPCNSVHTFGMGYPIDIVFLNSEYQVARVVSNCMPRRMFFCKNAKHTLELAAGQAMQMGFKVGTQIAIRIWA